MRNLLLAALLLVAALLGGAGCQSADTGSREYLPGQGWVPVDR